MTRKHFEAVAANFAWQNTILDTYLWNSPEDETVARRALRNLATDMCASFRTFNPNFNSDKFMNAAGF